MILGIDPKVDFAFKRMLGKESTRPILIDLIDSVRCPSPGHLLQDIELLNPFNLQETAEDKLSIVDIKARDQAGWQFNVEMQLVVDPSYGKRILYYGSRLHQQQLHEGERYRNLKPTISISLLNQTMFPQVPDYHLRFRLLEEHHHFPLSEDLEFYLLELPKFTKSADELKSGLDVWLYFFRHAAKINTDAIPAAFHQQPMVMRALEELKMVTQTELERERYEARRKAQMDFASGLEEARLDGLEKGRIEGEKIGIIHVCERMLNRPETPTEQLAQLSLEELSRLTEDLQEHVLKSR